MSEDRDALGDTLPADEASECFVVLDVSPDELAMLEAVAAGLGTDVETFAVRLVQHALGRIADAALELKDGPTCH